MDFERLVSRHKDAVYRQMVRVCGSYEDAEDALSEAILSAYRSSDSLRDEEAFRGWLATIGRRVCLRLRRKNGMAQVLDLAGVDLPAEGTPEEELVTNETKRCVRLAVDSLPDLYRETYVLREIEEVPAEEVAERLGLSISAVKSRLHRARKMVRERLDEDLCTA